MVGFGEAGFVWDGDCLGAPCSFKRLISRRATTLVRTGNWGEWRPSGRTRRKCQDRYDLTNDVADSVVLHTALTRHIRASSDPISRGGAFTGDSNGLEFEPNPFEQSFSGPRPSSGPTEHSFDHTKARGPTVNATAGPSSGLPVRRARSTSPVPTNPRTNSGGLHKLPPLSLIESPGVVSELQGFGWASDSLRTGPLSPSVLSGPSPSVPTSIFDPSMMRTGLTPLVGGSGVSFPPPSPATAALFAMMTNNTPGTSDAAIAAGMGGGGSRPHEGVNEGNHFEASFARATDGKGGIISSARSQIDPRGQQQQHQMHAQQHQLAHQQHQQQLCDFTPQHVQGPPAPLGVLQRPASQQPPPRSIIPQSMHPLQLANNPYMQSGYPPMTQQQQQQQHQLMQQQRHHPQQHQHQQSHQQQAYGNQNPLYLLSQAQDLSTHNDDAVVAAAALSNLSGPGFPAAVDETSTLNGSASVLAPKPESAKGSPAGSGKGKKVAAGGNKRKKGDEDKKAPPAKKGKKGKAADKEDEVDDFEDPGEEGSMSPQAHNPNETEEEKRKNFLERNRQGAFPFSLGVGSISVP